MNCQGKKIYYLPIWDEEKGEMISLKCSEAMYQNLMNACEEYKRKYDTFQTPYIILRKSGRIAVED